MTPSDYEPLSPVDVERKMRQLVTDLYASQKALREARDDETGAEIEYRRAQRRAILSPDCPKVARGGHTAADRDAWVEDRVDAEWLAYRLATTNREAAQDHLRVVLAVAETVRSLGASVRSSYGLAGVGA